MKRIIYSLLILAVSFIMTSSLDAQMQNFKVGHIYNVSLPDYMTKTYGLNTSASIQFKNVVKDVYGFIIEDTKEVLELAEMKYSNAKDFYEDFIKDFLKDTEKREITNVKDSKKNGINYMEADASYYDAESNVNVYYYVGIAETKSAYYKVLCWSTLENKSKFKEDFKKILYSIKD